MYNPCQGICYGKQLLSEHVTLEVECIDRLYVNGYIPQLLTGGQLASFLVAHRGNPIPSPALLSRITNQFKAEVEQFAAAEGLTLVSFQRSERKDDIAAQHREEYQHRQGTVSSASVPKDTTCSETLCSETLCSETLGDGVYLIGVAQEKASAFKSTKRVGPRPGFVGFDFSRQSVFVNHYYFYLLDEDFGPAFIKIGTYAPFPIKVYLNGHEWAKRQLVPEAPGSANQPPARSRPIETKLLASRTGVAPGSVTLGVSSA